jgi:hypothetical protein
MIEQLPKSTLKAFEKRFNGLMLFGGAAALIVPDGLMEYRIRKVERAIAQEEKSRGLEPGSLRRQYAQGPVEQHTGDNPQGNAGERQERSTSNGDGKWTDTLAPTDLITAYKLPGA